MSPELDNKLCEKYPKIFINRSKSPQESCMSWGFEVGDGWYDLLDTLCEALTYTYNTSIEVDEEDGKLFGITPYNHLMGKQSYYYRVEAPQVVADQVKEKFGSLRFYYHLEFDKENARLEEKYPDLKEVNKRYRDYIDGIVHFAEIASARTCEVTGAPGQLHVRNGWFKALNTEVAKTEAYADYKPYIPSKYENEEA